MLTAILTGHSLESEEIGDVNPSDDLLIELTQGVIPRARDELPNLEGRDNMMSVLMETLQNYTNQNKQAREKREEAKRQRQRDIHSVNVLFNNPTKEQILEHLPENRDGYVWSEICLNKKNSTSIL